MFRSAVTRHTAAVMAILCCDAEPFSSHHHHRRRSTHQHCHKKTQHQYYYQSTDIPTTGNIVQSYTGWIVKIKRGLLADLYANVGD